MALQIFCSAAAKLVYLLMDLDCWSQTYCLCRFYSCASRYSHNSNGGLFLAHLPIARSAHVQHVESCL